MPLPAGTYKVDVIVRDVTSGATGIRHVGFTVPRYDPQKLSTSTLVWPPSSRVYLINLLLANSSSVRPR